MEKPDLLIPMIVAMFLLNIMITMMSSKLNRIEDKVDKLTPACVQSMEHRLENK